MEPFSASGSDAPDLDLRHYLSVLWRRRWVIVATTVVLALAALLLALSSDDQFRATGELLVTSSSAVETGRGELSTNAERAVGNEVEIIGSSAVQAEVQKILGSVPSVSASTKGETDIILLAAESTDARAAADAVNAYASAYATVRTQRQVEVLQNDLDRVMERREQTQSQLSELLAPIEALDLQIGTSPPEAIPDLAVQREALNESIAGTRDELFLEITELDNEIQNLVDQIADPVGGVEVLNEAKVPTEPFAPQPRKDTLVAAAAGLLIGLGLALAWENLDDRVRDRRTLKRVAGSVPILGDVPLVQAWRRDQSGLSVAQSPHSPPAEAYRSLVTSIEFLRLDDRPVIHFTSAMPGEGKTTTVANLAAAFAEAGRSTLVIDGDMRRPRLHHSFSRPAAPGLSTVLAGQDDMEAAVAETAVPLVSLLPAGPIPPNPAELLHQRLVGDVIEKLRDRFDVVLIDAPPVNPVTDTLLLSAHATGTIVVAAAGSTRQRRLTRALESLEQAQARTIGVILNALADAQADYDYGYASDDADQARASRRRRRDTDATVDAR